MHDKHHDIQNIIIKLDNFSINRGRGRPQVDPCPCRFSLSSVIVVGKRIAGSRPSFMPHADTIRSGFTYNLIRQFNICSILESICVGTMLSFVP